MAQDNADLELKAGTELAKQVQFRKDVTVKEKALDQAKAVLDTSIQTVASYDVKIKENREKMYETINMQ